MTVTKEQWLQIENKLSGLFGIVKLRCDGYVITAIIKPLKPLIRCIAVYVDGYFKGIWLDGKDERCQKFFCAKKGYLYSAKQRAIAKEQLQKRSLNKILHSHYQHIANEQFFYWLPYWTSAKAFCRHIRKKCQSIELVEI